MIRKHFQLGLGVLGASVLFLILLTLAQANTTWAAHAEQGTVGGPPTQTPVLATKTPKPGKEGGPCATCATLTPTALPKLPTTGGEGGSGFWVIGIPLLLILGAGLTWHGLRLSAR